MSARGVEDPAAFRACAIDPPFYIDLHPIGHAVRRRSQSGKNAVVAQDSVSGHIKGADALVRADFTPGFLLDTAIIPPGDGHVQDALVGGEGDTVGVLGVCSGVAQGAIRRNPVHTVETELPFRLGQASTGVREVDAAIRAGHKVIGPIDALPTQALGEWSIRAVGFTAGDLPVIALTDEEPTLQVEGHAVGAAALLADNLRLATGRQSVDEIRTDIHEQPVALRVPDRPFGKHKTGGETFSLRGLHDIGKLGSHDTLPVLIDVESHYSVTSIAL